MKTIFIPKSKNSKTGPIPVSYTETKSCPPSCGLRHECYAKFGPVSWQWRRADQAVDDWPQFCGAISVLPAGQLWRHNIGGDLPGIGERINASKLGQLIRANRGKRGFTYTHKHRRWQNLNIIRAANRAGFVINLSADTIAQADELKATQAGPVVVAMPADFTGTQRTPAGHTIVQCPATRDDASITCASCKLCAIATRETIIGFPAHGTRKRALTEKLTNS